MRFQGLPVELHVGVADLTPVHSASVLKVCICTGCGRAGPSFFICDDSHVVCETCAVIEPSMISSGWCPKCDRPVHLSAGGIPLNVFAKMLFRCRCGFEGTLAILRKHLLTEGSHPPAPNYTSAPSTSYQKDATTAEAQLQLMDDINGDASVGKSATADAVRSSKVDVTVVKQKLLALIEDIDEIAIPTVDDQANDRIFFVKEITAVAKSVNDIMTWLIAREQQLDEMFRSIASRTELDSPRQQTDKNTDCSDETAILDIGDVQQAVRVIEQRLLKDSRKFIEEFVAEKIQKEIAVLSARLPNQIASSNVAFFWFDFHALYEHYQTNDSFVESEWQYNVIAGICFGANIEIDKIDNEAYLGFYAAPKEYIKTNAPWPLRRTVILSVHDGDGTIMKSKSYNSFMFDKYSGGYSSPSDSSAAGYKNFVRVSCLRSNHCLIKGLLCVSISVEPMKKTSCSAVAEVSPELQETTGLGDWY